MWQKGKIMKNKMLSLLLATVMAVSVCACSSKDVETNKDSSETKQSTAVNQEVSEVVEEDRPLYPLVDEPITVKAVYVGINKTDSTSRLVWDKVAEITGVNVEWEVIAPESLATYMAGGDWPDFIQGAISTNMVYDYGVLGGRFVNILDYLDVMPNLVQTMEDYPLIEKATTLSNGEMYELLYIANAATTVNVRPYVDPTVLEKAGVKMPKTVEEFEQALKDLKEYYGVVSFYPKLNVYDGCWAPMLYAAFGTGTNMQWDTDDNGTVYFAGMSDQMRHYYEFMNGLYEQELLHQELVTMEGTLKKELELAGNVAFLEWAPKNIPADENGVHHITCVPPLTSQYDSTQEVLGVSFIDKGYSIVINNESKYVKEVCQMLDIAFAAEEVVEGSGLYGQSFVYGLEGEHFVKNDDGLTYSFIWPEGYASFNDFKQEKLMWANFGRGDALAGLVTDTPSNNQARQIGFVENVAPYTEKVPFPNDLLVFNEDQQYIIDNKWTEIDTYVKKMQVEFITGVTDITEGWSVYCETLKKMGIDEVIAVYQEAYESVMGE